MLYFIYLPEAPHGRISTKFCTALKVMDMTNILTIG